MIIGYARVSTRDQNLNLQEEALKKAGCERIYKDIASGAKKERPALDEMTTQLRAGDVVVVWKIDRLGRSLKHLVELVEKFAEKGIGLKSLSDPIDTTHAQGRLVLNMFASLAEFERELIKERTNAGLASARARGRIGGRPKGLSSEAEGTALAAETLYREGKLGVKAIAEKLHISKGTLYSYLRHRGVEITPHKKTVKKEIPPEEVSDEKTITLQLHLRIHNNSKFVRGKKRSIENIEFFVLEAYDYKKIEDEEYELQVTYEDESELDEIVYDILSDIQSTADLRHCFSESEIEDKKAQRIW
jgi:DNA invertase Pin-like site-specific DNA recombinase